MTRALIAASAAAGVSATVLLTIALAVIHGLPVANVASVMLLPLALAGSATGILLRPVGAPIRRADVPQRAGRAAARGTAAPVPFKGCGTGVAQYSQRGGEGREVQPPPGVAALAGGRSRSDRLPTTLPTTEEGPGRRTPAGRPGPHTPSRLPLGWATTPSRRLAGRRRGTCCPARPRDVAYAGGRAAVASGGTPCMTR